MKEIGIKIIKMGLDKNPGLTGLFIKGTIFKEKRMGMESLYGPQ